MKPGSQSTHRSASMSGIIARHTTDVVASVLAAYSLSVAKLYLFIKTLRL
ncbi:MAG: hypothetical protein HQL04_05805 [Nitrospirae bacterium]|nr:hypothetical protein [Nitrospirota bacterium]